MFYNPVRTFFGVGVRAKFKNHLTNGVILIVCTSNGRQRILKDKIFSDLLDGQSLFWVSDVEPNPDNTYLDDALRCVRDNPISMVVAIGGGSVMDVAKVLRHCLLLEGDESPVLDQIQKPVPSSNKIPLCLFPTTAGTGSEVTPFATVWDFQFKRKHSLYFESVYADLAFIDAELLVDLPQSTLLASGLDAINQAMESIWNVNASPPTMAFAFRALEKGLKAIRDVEQGRYGLSELSDMAECSFLAGLAISNTRTAICHSISYPITAHYGVEHGFAVAYTMAEVLEFNLIADDGRFESLAKFLGVQDLRDTFHSLVRDLNVKEHVLAKVGSSEAILELSHEMITPSRAGNNLRPVTQENVREILKRAAISER